MLTLGGFALALLIGVPIGLCLCLGARLVSLTGELT
jgi:hypothetical protein